MCSRNCSLLCQSNGTSFCFASDVLSRLQPSATVVRHRAQAFGTEKSNSQLAAASNDVNEYKRVGVWVRLCVWTPGLGPAILALFRINPGWIRTAFFWDLRKGRDHWPMKQEHKETWTKSRWQSCAAHHTNIYKSHTLHW